MKLSYGRHMYSTSQHGTSQYLIKIIHTIIVKIPNNYDLSGANIKVCKDRSGKQIIWEDKTSFAIPKYEYRILKTCNNSNNKDLIKTDNCKDLYNYGACNDKKAKDKGCQWVKNEKSQENT